MTKPNSIHLTFLLIFSLLIFSCDTIRRAPSNASASSSKSRKPAKRPSNYRASVSSKPVGRSAASAKRPPASNKPTSNSPARSAYSISTGASGSAAEEIPKVVEAARAYAGTPYRSGGNDHNGIDCSGLICTVYSEIGVKVPRISWQQSEFGSEVGSIQEIKPGDWVFFVPEAGKEGYVSHAGIVTDVRNSDEIIFIHASTSRGVREDNLFSTYFKGRFVKAMRPF